ncbi:MAG: hypothetical protein QM783_01435 [Phycisphaerales bacterium]
MARFPSAAGAVPAVRGLSSAAWVRVALAAGLWCVTATPVYVMGSTAAKMEEIFRELGVRLGALQMTLLGIGRLLESPVALVCTLALLAAFCYAAALACIPPGTVAPADGAGPRPRWVRIICTVVGVGVLSFGLTVAYVASIVGTMQNVIDKLDSGAHKPNLVSPR